MRIFLWNVKLFYRCTIISDIINSRTLFSTVVGSERKTLEDDQQTPPESVSSSSRRGGVAL